MIHLWYLEIQPLLRNFMVKFISPKYLTKESTALGWHTVQENNDKKQSIKQNWCRNKREMSLCRTRLFALWKAKQKTKKIKKNWLKFYVNSISYLQSQLPFDNSFLKHAQCIHLDKRLDTGNIIAISNISLNIGRVMKNCLQSVFFVYLL